MTALVSGLFAARYLYELWPSDLGLLGDWPGSAALTGFVVCVFLLVALDMGRRQKSPDVTPLLLLGVYVLWPRVNLLWATSLLFGALALCAAFWLELDRPGLDRGRDRLLRGTLAVSVFGLYLGTLGDHVGRGDSFEFQVVAPELGIAHPTGYPLFILVGKLFSLLPLGNVAWRVNLMSAFFATAAVLLTYHFLAVWARRAGFEPGIAPWLAAFGLAVSRVFWSQAVVVEVYTLNAALVMATLILAADSRTLKPPLFLLLGLAVTHHLTALILLPVALLALVLQRTQLSGRTIGRSLILLALGLAPWVYFPLRWPAAHGGAAITWSDFAGWAFGQRFAGALNLGALTDVTRWSIVGGIVAQQFGLVGLGLGLVGFVAMLRGSWRTAVVTACAFAGYFFYGLVYAVADIEVFLIPVSLIVVIWIGITFSWASRFRWAVIVLALLPLSLVATNLAIVNQQGRDAELEAWGRHVLALPIPENSAILADSEKIAPLYYLQRAEGIRPDLRIMVLGDEAEYRRELDNRVGKGQPVYLARYLPNLPYHLRSLGPLVEVAQKPLLDPPPMNQTMAIVFGSDVSLLGMSQEPLVPHRVTFLWRAESAVRQAYHVRLRLTDASGEIWWEDAGNHPVSGYYPTNAWTEGEIVPDYHEIRLEPFVPAGVYTLSVGLFSPFRAEGLAAAGGEPWLELAQVESGSQLPPSLPVAVGARYEQGVTLAAAEEGGIVPPLGAVTLRTNWLGIREALTATVMLADDRGQEVARSEQIVSAPQTRLRFRAPADAGVYVVYLGLGRQVRCAWLAPLTEICPVTLLHVTAEAGGNVANFDNQVVLSEARVEQTTLQLAESVRVHLTWRGMKPWEANYTVFVHLIGPDGRVHGQVDQWPMQGTLPTSQWAAGKTVADSYDVFLPADSPAGRYHVEVGWYLLSTLRRLPVVDASGLASDDRVVVGGFTVP